MHTSFAAPAPRYQVRFEAIEENESRGLAFCCDARGNVELDRLSDRARVDYLFARALIGRNFARPAVVRVA
jgi:hypothetical protein